MKKIMFYVQRNAFTLLLMMAVAIVFPSCLKDKNNGPEVPAAGLMAFNLAPDQQSVVLRLSGSMLTQTPLGFTNYTGLYQRIYVGERSVDAYDYPETSPLASRTYKFEEDKFYSVFVVGYDNVYRNVIVEDTVESEGSTKAYVRYINAIADSTITPLVTLTSGGSDVVNENAAFAEVSNFVAVNGGEVQVAVKDGDNVDASRTITLQQGKAYTVLLLGVPGDNSDQKKVQIRFVENGTVVDEN